MAHSLTSTATIVKAATVSSTKYNKMTSNAANCVGYQRQRLFAAAASSSSSSSSYVDPSQLSNTEHVRIHSRRSMVSGGALAGIGLGMVLLSNGAEEAGAAARRPPPPPPKEKIDPNLSGVQAKVLASKKRKEAMKESIAKLREKGKSIISEPPPPPPPIQ